MFGFCLCSFLCWTFCLVPLAFYSRQSLSGLQLNLFTICVLKPTYRQNTFILSIITPQACQLMSIKGLNGVNLKHRNNSLRRVNLVLFHFFFMYFKWWYLAGTKLKVPKRKISIIINGAQLLRLLSCGFILGWPTKALQITAIGHFDIFSDWLCQLILFRLLLL